MKEKIESRLQELYAEYKHVTDPERIWLKETGGYTRQQRLERCQVGIQELEALLKN